LDWVLKSAEKPSDWATGAAEIEEVAASRARMEVGKSLNNC
jgi:hypothetical protein